MNIIPEEITDNMAEYLQPSELYKLVCLHPGNECYKQRLKTSLHKSLNYTLLHGKTEFNTPSPLKSFIKMTETLPPNEKVYLSGSTVLQAVLGNSTIFSGADIDIYATCGAAPYIRKWLIDKDVLQIFGGYSELYKYEESLLDTGSAKNNPICHIEYYINLGSINNKDLSRIEYNEHSIPLKLKYNRSFELVTNDKNQPIPCINYKDITKNKKTAVNIDLIVLKPGCLPQEVISDFDLVCCGCSFDGTTFRIPNPDMTFTGKTYLGNSKDVAITRSYLAYLAQEAKRDVHEIAIEMGLPERFKSQHLHKKSLYSSLIGCIHELFRNSDKWPVFPFRFPERDISFLKLVFDMRCHLISNAIEKLSTQGFHNDFILIPYPGKPHLFHNMIVGYYVSRYMKYLSRGVSIVGFDLKGYQDIGLLQEVEDIWELSKGMSELVAYENYYFSRLNNVTSDDGDMSISDMST